MSHSPTLLPVAGGAETWRAVRDLVRGHIRIALAAGVLLVAATVVGLATAPLLGRIVDIVTAGAPAATMWLPVSALAVVALGRGILSAAGMALLARLGETVLAALRERFAGSALALPLEQVERAGSGDLNSRVTEDVAVTAKAVRTALPELAVAALTIVLTLVALAVLDWRFLLVALLAVPVQVVTVRWYLRRAPEVYARQRRIAGAGQQQLLATIGGARTVRAFRLTAAHTERVRERSQQIVDQSMIAIRLVTGFFARLNLAEYLGLSGVLVAGFVLVDRGTVSVGTATAAALYFHSLFNPINVALALIDDAQTAAASLARLVGLDDRPTADRPARRQGPRGGAEVKLAAVRHSYRAEMEVLGGIDLEIGRGERVALVGGSGAGKTTLAKLVAGVHTATAGSILLGGIELGELADAEIRGTVSMVTQEGHVFAGPLQEDLRLAAPQASDEQLAHALRRVGAANWVQALPEGMHTVVGEGGHRLTLAQAQQLALARVLLADPAVVILDEATADAGSAGARVLEAAAEEVLAGRTALVVAHRLSQAAAADKVIVLEAGRVVESGTHQQLRAAGGPYAQLWQAWAHSREQS